MRFSDYPEWLSNQFLAGKFSNICLAHHFPVTLSVGARRYEIPDQGQMLRLLATVQAIVTYHGAYGVSTEMVNAPEWGASSFEVDIRHAFVFTGEDAPKSARMRFVLEQQDMGPGIREINVSAFPFDAQIMEQKVMRDLRSR